MGLSIPRGKVLVINYFNKTKIADLLKFQTEKKVFLSNAAALNVIYLAIESASEEWTIPIWNVVTDFTRPRVSHAGAKD